MSAGPPGFELALLLPPLLWIWRRRRARRDQAEAVIASVSTTGGAPAGSETNAALS